MRGATQSDDAIRELQQALRERPDDFALHNNLAGLLQDCGRLGEAAAHYRKALGLQPQQAELHNNLGTLLAIQGDFEHAVQHFEQAVHLKPDYYKALKNLGLALARQDDAEAALACFEQALRLVSDDAEIYEFIAQALFSREAFDEAEVCFRNAARRHPDLYTVRVQLATALYHLNRLDEAEALLRQVIEEHADCLEAYRVITEVLKEQRRPADALPLLDRGREALPDVPLVQALKAETLMFVGRSAAALVEFEAAMPRLQDLPGMRVNHAIAYEWTGRSERAREILEELIRDHPAFAPAHNSLAHVLMRSGDYERGLEEIEWREKAIPAYDRKFPEPRWEGSPLAGRTLLVHAEQGLGDTLNLVRYLRMLEDCDGRVIFECQRPLLRLICQSVDPRIEVIPRKSDDSRPDVAFDVHVPLLSLARIYRTTLSSVPNQVPYLHADAADVRRWAALLEQDRGFRVGLVWAGNPYFRADAPRSMSLDQLAPLAGLCGVTFYVMQKGSAAVQADDAPRGMRVVDLSHHLHDFAETAALMENLDLVLSTCTSPAHLGGALGRPTWIMLHDSPFWLWMSERQDSPWYPTMRLFRQREPGNWTDVAERVAAALRERVARERAAAVPETDGFDDALSHLLAAETFVPAGADVLDISPRSATVRWSPPPGCRLRAWPGERLLSREAGWEDLPPGEGAEVILALSLLDRLPDVAAALTALRRYDRPVIVDYAAEDEQRTRAAAAAAGFVLRGVVRRAGPRLLLRLAPSAPAASRLRRLVVLVAEDTAGFGGGLRRQLLQAVLPAATQVTFQPIRPWRAPPEEGDLVLLGTGGFLRPEDLTDELIDYLRSGVRTVGLFGLAFRGAVDRARARAVLDRLAAWFAVTREDAAAFAGGSDRCVHFGHWLVNAFPTVDAEAAVPPGPAHALLGTHMEVADRIQRVERYFADDVDLFTCALTGVGEVSYCDERDPFTGHASGTYRSVMMDIFGHSHAEERLFRPQRAAVAAYRDRMLAMARELQAMLGSVLG